MNKGKSINIKTTIATISLILLAVVVQLYSNNMKDWIKVLLQSNYTEVFLWSFITVTILIHKILYNELEGHKDGVMYQHFGKYADTFLDIGTYGFSVTTSTSLIEGLYMQHFYHEAYFIGFDSFDLISMFLVTSFLFVYGMVNVTKKLFDIFFYTQVAKVK